MGPLNYFKEVLEVAKQINVQMEKAMVTAQNFRDVLTEIGTEITRIEDLVKASDLTGAEEQEILDGLKGLKDRVVSVKVPVTTPVEPPVDPPAETSGRKRF